MRAAGAWIDRTVGLRGVALAGCGLGWATYGIGIITDPRYGVSRGVTVLTHVRPLSWWGAMWIACGLIGMAAAALRTGKDRFGFGAVCLPPLVWALAYVVTIATGEYSPAWTSTPAWCVPVLLLAVVAALSARLTRASRRIRALEALSIEEHADGS